MWMPRITCFACMAHSFEKKKNGHLIADRIRLRCQIGRTAGNADKELTDAISIANKRRNIISHTVTIKTEVRDAAAVKAACERLRTGRSPCRAKPAFQRRSRRACREAARLVVSGRCRISPPVNWPMTTSMATGATGRNWIVCFKPTRLRNAASRARKKGHVVTESQLADGSIKLTVQVGGAA